MVVVREDTSGGTCLVVAFDVELDFLSREGPHSVSRAGPVNIVLLKARR